jgi:AcrR family transcriptional regulator
VTEQSAPPLEAAETSATSPVEEGNRERIIAQAIRLFCEKGYEATSVREIVEAVGVTKPVLYYYFKNKDELFRFILQNSMDPLFEEIQAVVQDPNLDFWSKLTNLIDLHIEGARQEPELVRFLHAVAFSNLYRDTFDFQENWIRTLRILAELFADAQKKGLLRDDRSPLFLVRNFMGMTYSEIRSLVYSPEILDSPISSKDIVDLFRKGAMP